MHSARQAVRNGRVELLNQLSLVADAIEMGFSIEFELNAVLIKLLDETAPVHYAGSKPPQRSYEQDIKGLELFAFIMESSQFKCRVYFKFALEEEIFWLVSLHPDRPKKGEP